MTDELAAQIVALDPLNLFINFEQTSPDMNRFSEKIRSEMPVQSFLELAVWYYSLGLIDKCCMLLKAAPANAEVSYWLAFLHKDTPDETALLKEADAQNPAFVFPFRTESKTVFDWVMTKSVSWKPTYYMALLQGAANNMDVTRTLLENMDNYPEYPPFYSLRAQLAVNDVDKERDLRKAVSLAPTEWRYIHQLTNYYIDKRDYVKALQTIKPFYPAHKNHFQTASLYARTLSLNKQYANADKILNNIHILPFEGERGGRIMYREIKMMLAINALTKGKIKEARKKVDESNVWPHSLGVGKPYDDMIDDRLENWIYAMIAIQSKNIADKDTHLIKVAQSKQRINNPSGLLQCVAWAMLGRKQQADDLFAEWQSLQRNDTLKQWGDRFYKNNRDKDYPFDLDEMTQLVGFISGGRDTRLF